MRPFAEMAWEFIRMAVPIVEGVSTGKWEDFKAEKPGSKSELLRLWDKQTTELNEKFPKIPLSYVFFSNKGVVRLRTAAFDFGQICPDTALRGELDLPIVIELRFA